MLSLYIFQHADGVQTTITAHSEAEAREKAMTKRWGPAPYTLKMPLPSSRDTNVRRYFTFRRWRGSGLDLINAEPVLQVETDPTITL